MVPWQFTVAIVLRDVLLTLCLLVLRRYGYGPPPVHYIGKTATFILLFAFPLLLLAKADIGWTTFWYATGWAMAWWGIVLYWIAGRLLRHPGRRRACGRPRSRRAWSRREVGVTP